LICTWGQHSYSSRHIPPQRYLEVQRDQREDQGLEVLNEVVEDAEPLRIRRVLHILEGADFGRLPRLALSSYLDVGCDVDPAQASGMRPAYLKRNVLATQPNFQFLAAVLVLLGPLGIVFSVHGRQRYDVASLARAALLQDIALFDNALDLGNKGIADAHCLGQHTVAGAMARLLALFANQRVVAIVGIIGIARRGAAAVPEHTEVEFWRQ